VADPEATLIVVGDPSDRTAIADATLKRKGLAALSAFWRLELAGSACGGVPVDPLSPATHIALAADERMFAIALQLGGSSHVPGIGDQLAQPGDVDGGQRTITSGDQS